MKYFNTKNILIVLLFIILFQNMQHNTKVHNQSSDTIVKKNIPLFNYNTQRIEPFTRIGVLYKNDSNVILPLYGRRTHVRSNTWNYYTMTNDESKIKLEIKIKNKQCLRKIGCTELYNGDTVHIPEYNGFFSVNLYI